MLVRRVSLDFGIRVFFDEFFWRVNLKCLREGLRERQLKQLEWKLGF
jgi:hypothetical protein